MYGDFSGSAWLFLNTVLLQLGFYPQQMRTIDLSKNQLSGTIHPYMKYLTKLESLNVGIPIRACTVSRCAYRLR